MRKKHYLCVLFCAVGIAGCQTMPPKGPVQPHKEPDDLSVAGQISKQRNEKTVIRTETFWPYHP